MPDFDFDLRSKILTLRPTLGLTKANELIKDLARSFQGIQSELIQAGSEFADQDFFTFVCADWLFVAAIFRQEDVTFMLFEANHTFIQDSEDLSSLQVEPLVALIEEKATGSITNLKFAMSQAHPWLEKRAAGSI